jgi:putative membrane protein
MGYGGMGWMPFMGIFWLFVLIVLVAAVMGGRRGHWWYDGPEREERRSAGLAILEERYARGEINRDEYLQKKQDILGHSSTR